MPPAKKKSAAKKAVTKIEPVKFDPFAPEFDRFSLRQLVMTHPLAPPEIPSPFIWTSSSLKLFRRCKRKFYWKYIHRLVTKRQSSSLVVGTAFHNALADWYSNPKTTMEKVAERHAEKLKQQIQDNLHFFDQDEADKAQQQLDTLVGMLTGYGIEYGKDRKAWVIEKSGIETKFDVDCGSYRFQGKIDGCFARKVAGYKGHRPFLIEHKTASRIGESYIDRLPMDTQCRAYMFGAKHGLGVRAHDVLYDVVAKSKLRRKSGESLRHFSTRVRDDYLARPGHYFWREALPFSDDDIESFRFELHQANRELELIKSGEFGDPLDPRAWQPNDGECNAFFKTCEYMRLDNSGLDHGTAMLYDQSSVLHGELEDD